MPAKISKCEWEKRISDSGSGKYELVDWAHTSSHDSSGRVTVRCIHDGYTWSASVLNLVFSGSGCPVCKKKRKWTPEERIDQINSKGGIEFLQWIDGYKNGRSRAILRCKVDGHEWSASVSDLVNIGSGCPKCSGLMRKTEYERICDINSLANIRFVCWTDGYKNSYSKAVVRCHNEGHEWTASVNSLVNTKRGCPCCAKSGYDSSKPGYLYALRSECGKHVKIGISNRPRDRHCELKRSTPFDFVVIESIKFDGKKAAELEKCFHEKYESSGFVGFDGATEWLICTPSLLDELKEVGH